MHPSVEFPFKGDRNIVVTSGLVQDSSTFPAQPQRKRSHTGLWRQYWLVNSAVDRRRRFPATGLHVTHCFNDTIYNALPPNKLSIKAVSCGRMCTFVVAIGLVFDDFVLMLLLCGTFQLKQCIWKVTFSHRQLSWGCCLRGLQASPYIETLSLCR